MGLEVAINPRRVAGRRRQQALLAVAVGHLRLVRQELLLTPPVKAFQAVLLFTTLSQIIIHPVAGAVQAALERA